MLEQPDVDSMFRVGARYRWADGTYSTINVRLVGELRLPTGRLVAQDPGWGIRPRVQPFVETLRPGRYPVTLSISRWDRSPDSHSASTMELVNAARLTVRSEPSLSWELALQSSQVHLPLEKDSIPGFGVDSGAACYLDAAGREYLEYMSRHESSDLANAMRESLDVGGIEVLTDDPGINIIVFRCGMGDGTYPTWIGRGKSGDITCFVSDLELLHHSLGPDTHRL